MNIQPYQRLLLQQALHAIACDGHIDSREVEELRRLTASTPYFDEIDVEAELSQMLNALRVDGLSAVQRELKELSNADLSARQRFRVLDVLLQVVHADEAVDASESMYLQQAQHALGLTTDEVAKHFPSRFAAFMPGAGKGFDSGSGFRLPEALPDISQFIGKQ